MKQSLRKITGKQILTHKEFLILPCQIEASLNFRPLTIIFNDPNCSTEYLNQLQERYK